MIIVGIDEVGRGCWAGPLVAGAVSMQADYVIPTGSAWRLNDSKRLTKSQREAADTGLRATVLSFSLGWVTAVEIDAIGLSAAVALAMQRALDGISGQYEQVIIDGNINYLPKSPKSESVVKADGSIAAVSAASIIAKVARDTWMATEAASMYPGYGFERHVGYGTEQHRSALAQLGPCQLHRYSFKPVSLYSKNSRSKPCGYEPDGL